MLRRRFVAVCTAVCTAFLAGGCAAPLHPVAVSGGDADAPARPQAVDIPTTTMAAATTTSPPSLPSSTSPQVVTVEYRIENRSTDPATAGFAGVVSSTLTAPQGWQQAGFSIDETPDAVNLVVLAEPDEAQALCLPYDVYHKYSCQNGPLVVLNAQRWRDATPEWTADLASYRQMLVNHEFGHLLGQRHVACGPPGQVAPVMCQQSTELGGALANPWPLPDEIARAARHDRPIAPPYGQ